MKKIPLWNLSVKTTHSFAPMVEELLTDEAKAITVFAPPRQTEVAIDAIFDVEPNVAEINARLITAALCCEEEAPKITVTEVGNLDWLKKVASDFPPLRIARWTVHGATHRAAVPDRKYALQIDATNAFGTGEHPTTRGCLTLLDKLLRNDSLNMRCMLDVGCGSGILSMAFAQATHGFATAVDLDPEAVVIAKDNAKTNGLAAFVHCGLSNGYRSAMVKNNAPYDLVMANIFAGPLCQLAPDLKKALRPGGVAILAGLLSTQANRVISAHRAQGLFVRHRLVSGEWTILALQRPFAS